MKRKRFTEEQIAFALRQAEAGTPVEEVCRKLGVSEPTFYRRPTGGRWRWRPAPTAPPCWWRTTWATRSGA